MIDDIISKIYKGAAEHVYIGEDYRIGDLIEDLESLQHVLTYMDDQLTLLGIRNMMEEDDDR